MRFDPQTNRIPEEDVVVAMPPEGGARSGSAGRLIGLVLVGSLLLGGAWFFGGRPAASAPPERVSPQWSAVVSDFQSAEALIAEVEAEVETRETGAESRAAYEDGRALLAIGRAGDAVEQLRHSVELDPSFAQARYDLAIAYIRTGEKSSARAERDALRDLDPDLANLLSNLVR